MTSCRYRPGASVRLLVPDGLVSVFVKLLISRDFHTQQSVEFTPTARIKNIQCAAVSADGGALLMREVRRE